MPSLDLFDIGRYPTYQVFLMVVLTMVAAGALFPLWIKLLRFRNIGQQVRADGPQGHLLKQGTPTMGGVLILIVITAAYLGFGRFNRLGLMALATTLACGLLGFVDDYAKVLRERSLGLTPRAKVFWQALISIVFGIAAVNWGGISSKVALPLIGGKLDRAC